MEFGIKHVVGDKGDRFTLQNQKDFYKLLFIKDKGCSLFIGGNLVDFDPYTLVFIALGEQLDHNPQEVREFTIIYFSEVFYCRTDQDYIFLKNYRSFNSCEYAYQTLAAPKEFSPYYELVDMHIGLAKQHVIEPVYRDLAHNFIKQILLLGAIYLDKTASGELLSIKQDTHLVARFQQLVLEHVKQQKQVTFYSDLLGISPRKLNLATKEVLGHKSKEVIMDGLIRIGKRYLLNSHLNVKQIAWELGYADENNFSAVFSKECGMTPTEYRKHWKG